MIVRTPLIVAASLAFTCGALAQSCGKTGGTLTYVYHPEPTALSTRGVVTVIRSLPSPRQRPVAASSRPVRVSRRWLPPR
jgi:hypothetical protein